MEQIKLEQAAKRQIERVLGEEGYPTYAKLLDKLDVKFLSPQEQDNYEVAYLNPSTATIYFNPDLNIDQVSMIARHEILHEYLTHMIRSNKWRELSPSRASFPHSLVNVAADYEISNRGYTERDKWTARNIVLRDKTLKGLVTEDDHPDWVNLSLEEMLDELEKDVDNQKQQFSDYMKDLDQQIQDSLQDQQPQDSSQDSPSQQNQQAQQQASQMQRQAQQQKQEAEEDKQEAQSSGDKEAEQQAEQNKQAAEQNEKKAQQIKDAAEKNQEQIDKNNEDKKENGGPFETSKQQEIDAETLKRAQEFKDALNELKNKIFEETDKAIEAEKIEKKSKALDRYKKSTPVKLIRSLDDFIKKETERLREFTWSRPNKKSSGTGIFKKGIARRDIDKIPLLNVYFDVSGSFTYHPQKIAEAERILSTLNKYIQRGVLKIKLYYVTDDVYTTREEAEHSQWGANGDAILKHVLNTKPDNVMIVTDNDSAVDNGDVVVPGAVWVLFYESESNIADHIKGKKLTKTFLQTDF